MYRAACTVVIIVMLSLTAFNRNAVWGEWTGLWTNVIKNSPEKGRGYVNLGVGYAKRNYIKMLCQHFKLL